MYKKHSTTHLAMGTLFASTLILLASCNKSLHRNERLTPEKEPSIEQIDPGITKAKTPKTIPLITVTNLKGEPIERAQVLFGTKIGQPFVNNFVETNQSGQVTAPEGWDDPLSITVSYPEHMKVTYYQALPQNLSFKLRPLAKASQIQLAGKTTNFGSLRRDNIVDFGLVIQALTRSDLFSFNIDKLVSPESDNLKFGPVEAAAPSNLTFPSQQETYVVPIPIEKERYRLYFREPGLFRTYALHGQFPFKETIDQFRNKVPFTTLINSFHFVSGGLKEFQLDGPLELNLPVNENNFTAQETLLPPPVAPNYFMLSVSISEVNGFLYPTDMHKAEGQKPFALKSIESSQRHFLSVLAFDPNGSKASTQRQEASSLEFVPQSPNHTPQFISLVPVPTGTTTGWTTAQTPTTVQGVNPLTTFSVFSRVVPDGKRKKIIREWEVYAQNWVQNIELPEWPVEDNDPVTEADAHRWEVVYIGSNQKLPISSQSSFGPDVAELTSHVSFNSVEF